jgi:peptide/nickel transport system substrate-binding protein
MSTRIRRATVIAGLAAAAAVGAASVLATGAAASRSAQAPQRGGNLVIDTATPSQNFDVNQTSDNESIWPYDEMAETLYVNGPDGKMLKPWLATSYTLSKDKLHWTFQLRHGVRFSNGKPMTAKDAAFSIEQALNPKSTWSFVDTAIKSAKATGPYSLVVTTKHPWAPLVADLALFTNAVIPADFGGQTRAQFFQHPIGTGPFEFSKWVKGQYLKLVRNPYYWQKGKPYLDSVTYQAVADDNTRVVQLRGGQANIIEGAPFAQLSSLKSSGYQLGLFPSTRIDYVTMNELQAPFKDVHVRRAISYAIDRNAIIHSIFFGQGQVATSPFMPKLPFFDASSGVLPYDLAKAKAEMAQSKYPTGGFSVDFIAGAGDQVQTGVAQIVQSDLKALGITVNIRQLDPSEVTTQEQSFHFGMRETYWTMDIADPDEYVSFTFCGTCGAFANWTHFNDPVVDSLTKQADKTFDVTKRAAIYAQLQKRVASDAPIVWIGYSPYRYVYSSKVHGYQVYPEGNAHLENVWLSK